LHLRVDLPDSRYTLVSEGGDEGADEELQYVDVAQGLDQSPEGPRPTLPAKASPGTFNPVFQKFTMQLSMDACAFKFRSCMEP
jgi:hypothetical protein